MLNNAMLQLLISKGITCKDCDWCENSTCFADDQIFSVNGTDIICNLFYKNDN
jgi:hypothetical protein